MLPIICVIAINLSVTSSEPPKPLRPSNSNEFLTNYEIVDLHPYVQEEPTSTIGFLKQDHEEVKTRSCNRLWFTAFGKTFHMSLRADRSFLLPDAIIEIHKNNEIRRKYFREIEGADIFEGVLDEDERSKILGYFEEDHNECVFTGSINTENCTYFLEPAVRHSNRSLPGQLLVYREFDVVYPTCAGNGSCKDYSHYVPPTEKTRRPFFLRKNESYVNDRYPDRTCSMESVADHTFFEFMKRHEGNTIADMLYHIKTADSIFRATDFNEDKRPDRIGFSIKKITIFEDRYSIGYPLNDVVSTPADFLDKLSLYIQNYCLLACFVHREFPEDVVGMAYRAEPDNSGAVGGICESPVILTDGKLHSLNIAAVSTLNRGKCIPKAVVSNSLVHELGHCFGSLHDPLEDVNCSPGGEEGNFIMSAYTNDGTRNNNKVFSLCSLRTINNAIQKKGYCLNSEHVPCCGNGITEKGEECDCGNKETCDIVDTCCTPQGGLGRDKECMFRRDRGYMCSPRESQCCSKYCLFISKSENHTCSNYLPCSLPSLCNGRSARCPRGEPLSNGTPCLGTAYTCNSGECNSTVCLDHRLRSCQCSAESGMSCHICCLNDLNECLPASELSLFTKEYNRYLKLEGSECNGHNGRCNREGECVAKGEGNKKESSRKSIISWLLAYWPYLLIIVLCITIIALIIYITRNSAKQRENTSANAVTLTSIMRPPHLYSKEEIDMKIEQQ